MHAPQQLMRELLHYNNPHEVVLRLRAWRADHMDETARLLQTYIAATETAFPMAAADPAILAAKKALKDKLEEWRSR